MAEGFRPVSNTPPVGLAGKIKFYGRMLLDLQTLTIYRDIKKMQMPTSGSILDVGCGQSPYKQLLNPSQTRYVGIDILDADKFDYSNPDITPFNGEDIPFEDGRFDALICTEVLEHVHNYQKLVDEMHRVMKPHAPGIVTIPWSARYHYIPHDYFRYTPSTLKLMFSKFSEVNIQPRGTDVVSIVGKIIVLWFRNLLPAQPWKWILVPLWVMALPILAILVLLAHLALLLHLGSDDDPLGYTIFVKK